MCVLCGKLRLDREVLRSTGARRGHFGSSASQSRPRRRFLANSNQTHRRPNRAHHDSSSFASLPTAGKQSRGAGRRVVIGGQGWNRVEA